MAAELKHLGAVVRQERLRRQLSQEGLAALARLSRTQVGEIERGTANISFASLVAISAALQVKLSEIIGRYEERVFPRKR
jgi:XRE family transcriptional regulator, regulator of sulfur utilization